MDFSKIIQPKFRRTQKPPKYFEEFFGGAETKYADQRPSNIFQSRLDDRIVVPRLGIKNSGKSTVTYIKVVHAKTGEKIGNKSLHNIRINSLQADKKQRQLINSMKHFGWEELTCSTRSMHTSMQPSSSIECMNEDQAKFKQNWQVCVLSYNRIVINIYEYQLIWYEEGGKENHALDCQMNYIGRTLIILKEPFQVFKKINFLPYYPNKDDLFISGTQLVPETDQKFDFQHFVFENNKPEDIQFKTNLSNCNFKQYENVKRQMVGFMLKCQITSKHIHSYSNQEKNEIFDLQQRVVSNMVMNKDLDIDTFIENVIEKENALDIHHEHATDEEIGDVGLTDLFAPLEILNCQSIVDYLQNSPNILSRLLIEQQQHHHPPNCLIRQLILSVDEEKREEYEQSLQGFLPENFVRQFQEVSDDLFFNNPIFRCFEDLKKRRKSCQKLIQLSLDAPKSTWIHARLMQILPMIVKSKSEFEEYGYFFQDYDGRDEKTTFAIKMLDLDLPDYAVKSDNLRKLTGADLSMNYTRDIKAQIQNEDDQEQQEKSIMVKHFIIDFSKLILMFKIRHDMEDTVQTNVIKKGEVLTMYDMQYYVYRITRKYSRSIEQCDTIRAIIDDQFFKMTSSYFNKLFLFFVLFFILPYLIQIFPVSPYLVTAAVISCLCFIAWSIYDKVAFIKVVGFAKFVKNVQNAIDMILIIVYILYSVLRFIHKSQLPSPANTSGPGKPSYWLGESIILNFTICILIISKLMILIRINQTFSQLAELVIVCIRDVIPFLIFLFTWILIFCVLYKVLGAMHGVDEQFPEIHPVFGFFLYTFENSIGNINNPTFKWWIDIIDDPKYNTTYTFGYLLAKTLIYLIYLVWFLNQYFIYILLLNFLIAVISQSYADVMANANISQYKQRAVLNRECLIRSKAFGQDEEINVLILSADTCDESLESKWFTFLQTIRKLLNQSQVDFEENVKDGQEHLENKINQVQEQLQQEMKEQNEITIKMVKKIIQTQENAQNARNQTQHQIRMQMQNAQMGQGQRQGGQQQQQQRQGQQQQQQRQGQQQQQQRQGQAQLRNPSMNQSVLGSISEQIELESNIPRSQSMALDIVPNSRSESMNSQQSQPQPKKKKQIKKKGTF